MNRIVLLLCLSTIMWACKAPVNHPSEEVSGHLTKPRHAQFFYSERDGDIIKAYIINPWDTTQVMKSYYLYPKNNAAPSIPEGYTALAYPLERVACAHSTQVAFLNVLDQLDAIKGIGSRQYVANPVIKSRVESGTVKEFGKGTDFDYERLLEINPEVLTVSPLRGQRFEKCEQLDIQLIYNLSYMETNPLGRAEWIKFMALFMGEQEKAERYFNAVEARYNELKEIGAKGEYHPSLVSGKLYGQIWNLPGGESYMAHIYKDAGFNYLWSQSDKTGSESLDYESVFAKAGEADYWCFVAFAPGTYTKAMLLEEYDSYRYFKAYQENERIIYCNSASKSFYEEGILEPHEVLADLISLSQPGLLPERELKYFSYLTK